MLTCDKISKRYRERMVLDDFSYKFDDTGFYLLFGESGCGKTTLLNILSGLLPFDGGNITINENSFDNIVDKELIAGKSDYITQDTFFVDFLNVYDNLLMITQDEERIKEMLEKFGLISKAGQYPSILSGGEKQRLAIVRALAGGKKILFLDEPTASLDIDNKLMVFEMLSEIKKDVLVICSSHDSEAKRYADEVIELKKQYKICDEKEITAQKGHAGVKFKRKSRKSEKSENKSDKKQLSYFLKKWFKSKRRDRKSSILFCIFLTIAMCICSLADTPQNKIDSNIEYVYKVNMCMLQTYGKKEAEYEKLNKIKGISEVVIGYDPRVDIDPDKLIQTAPDYELSAYVLPFKNEAFRLSDKIRYGTYFTQKNQVIITSEMAEAMSDIDISPEELIGRTITKKFYKLGEVELEIVGIFDRFNDFEKMYLNSMGMYLHVGNNHDEYMLENEFEDMWFINGEFTKQYEEDYEFYTYDQRNYTLFFDSYKDMKSYYDDNYKNYRDGAGNVQPIFQNVALSNVFGMLCRIFLPLAFFVAFFTVLFYVNLIKTEIAYNNKFISIFDYAGYGVKKVIRCFILLNLKYQLKLSAVSVLSALVITNVFNAVNRKYIFVEFQVFTYNVPILSGFIILLTAASVIFTTAFLWRFKSMNWYENIIKQRDLI